MAGDACVPSATNFTFPPCRLGPCRVRCRLCVAPRRERVQVSHQGPHGDRLATTAAHHLGASAAHDPTARRQWVLCASGALHGICRRALPVACRADRRLRPCADRHYRTGAVAIVPHGRAWDRCIKCRSVVFGPGHMWCEWPWCRRATILSIAACCLALHALRLALTLATLPTWWCFVLSVHASVACGSARGRTDS